MGFAWKILIPLGLFNIGASGAIILWAHPWRIGMAIFQWVFFLGFIGLFDPVMRRRLRRQRERLAVTI